MTFLDSARQFLELQGFPSDEDSQLVLLDEPGWPNRPTLHNMRRAIQWLTHEAKTGACGYSDHMGFIWQIICLILFNKKQLYSTVII